MTSISANPSKSYPRTLQNSLSTTSSATYRAPGTSSPGSSVRSLPQLLAANQS